MVAAVVHSVNFVAVSSRPNRALHFHAAAVVFANAMIATEEDRPNAEIEIVRSNDLSHVRIVSKGRLSVIAIAK